MWITVEVERVLRVDRGRNVILCDPMLGPGHQTLVLKLKGSEMSNDRSPTDLENREAALYEALSAYRETEVPARPPKARGLADRISLGTLFLRMDGGPPRPSSTITDAEKQMIIAALRQAWPKEIRSFVNEIIGVWAGFEPGLRQEIGNTNYAVVQEKLTAVEALLASPADSVRNSCADELEKEELKRDLSTVENRNAFYSSDEYRNMTTAEKCAVQQDGFINDHD